MGSRVTLRCTGGAIISFDIGPDTMGSLHARVGYAVIARSDRSASASYRETHDDNGGTIFVRHDDRRECPVEVVGSSVDDLIDDLHLTVALHSSDDVFVHAGAVSWNGSAIVLPGRSHAGKSTLVHALVCAGAAYLSDEYARITADGLIAPYHRPLQLRTPTGRRLVDPSDIGEVEDRTVPAGMVVFTHYTDGGTFSPEPMSPAQAALALIGNTVIADVDPVRAAAAAARVSRVAFAVRTPRPDAYDTAQAILALADRLVVAV